MSGPFSFSSGGKDDPKAQIMAEIEALREKVAAL